MELTHSGRSERGPRASNQDFFLLDPALGLFIVADGMGGHRAGEVASKLAVETVANFVRATVASGELTWPFAYDPTQSMSTNRLTVAMRLANRKVHDAGRSDTQFAGMGTTLVVALVADDRVTIAHVGDSRAYRFRGGRLEAMTADHTWVAAMLAADANAPVADHPMRHVLTSGIGMREDVTPSVAEEAIVAGDRWLLCTDGVHGYVKEPALADALMLPSADAAAEAIVRAALDAGGTDNATAIVLRFD